MADKAIGRVAQPDNLVLSKKQIAFIENNTPKVLAWGAYWTSPGAMNDSTYVENIGKRMAVKLISLRGAVIVFMPQLPHKSVIYVKMPDGHLDYPGFSSWTTGNNGIESFIETAQSSSGWGDFLSIIRSEEGKELNLTEGQKQVYINLFSRNPEYITLDGEIIVPSLGPPIYDSDSEDKQLLLERIIRVAVKHSEMTYKKGDLVTITVPNLNLGDPSIWVLIENEKKSGVVIDIQLNTNPKQEPVSFAGFVMHDINVERYGLKTDTVEKLRLHTYRLIQHRVR